MLKVQLTRDLRKNILRGHPWIYREAIKVLGSGQKAELCEVLDKKKKTLAWAIYCPQGPLALRILSTERKPPNPSFYQKRMEQAWQARENIRATDTNAYRLFNGEGDGLPGLVCDVYDHIAVIQFDGPHCFAFWDHSFVADFLLQKKGIVTVYLKPRRSGEYKEQYWGESPDSSLVEVRENGVLFLVNYVDGQKTGFFLDQRDNRQYLKNIAKDKKVLNLFSYTGGFSLYAAAGGAQEVKSVDLSKPALELAEQSFQKNNFESSAHQTVAVDVFAFMDQEQEGYDIVMVDPPSMTHSEKTKMQAIKSYADLFAKSARLVEKGGHLVVSSCSSHIHFEDFFEIIDEALSQARRVGKIQRVSGQGSDHPFPHYCRELRYLKFVDIILN